MVQAQPHLANATRPLSHRADNAETQVTELLKLYRRQPAGMGNIPIPFPASYAPIAGMIGQPNTHPSAHVLATMSSSPPTSHPSTSAPSMSYGFDLHPEVPGLTLGSSANTDPASEDIQVDPDLHAGTDLQLLAYMKERAMTWDDLKKRPPLFPGAEGGTYQFSCAEQIIRGEWRH
jgi:hypothetical protein